MTKGKNVLTTGDVAKICNVAPRTVSKWFDSGQLKGYRIPGSKDRRIPLSELIRFMKVHNMPATAIPVGTMRILIVDSEESRSQAWAESLRSKGGYEVEAAHSNFETGLLAQKFVPHVMLISLVAKDIDSTDICRTVRASDELQTIKLIAIVHELSDSECNALLQRGFDGYVSDVGDVTEMMEKIEETTAIVY